MSVFRVEDGGPRPKPLPATQLKAAPVVDIEEYREAIDCGDHAAVALLHDGLGADPIPVDPPPLTPKEKNLIAGELQGMRVSAIAAAKMADRPSSRHLHHRILEVVDELDRMTIDLAGGNAA